MVEIIVYAGLALLITFAALSILSLGRQAGTTAALSYSLGRDVDTAVRTLRDDLRGTSINSVRISYNPPGISFLSAVDDGTITLNPMGVPGWRKFINYTLEPRPGAATANLVRWEMEARVDAPTISDSPVGPASGRNSRVLLRNVVLPGGSSPAGPADRQSGGFVVRFVRSYSDGTEELSDRNPVDFSREGGSGGSPRPYPSPPPRAAPVHIISVDAERHHFFFRSVDPTQPGSYYVGASSEDIAWAQDTMRWEAGDRKSDPPRPTTAIMIALASAKVEKGWTQQDVTNWQNYRRDFEKWAADKAAWDARESEEAAQRATKAIDGNTSMLEVRLTAVDAAQNASAPNCTSLKFRVHCRY